MKYLPKMQWPCQHWIRKFDLFFALVMFTIEKSNSVVNEAIYNILYIYSLHYTLSYSVLLYLRFICVYYLIFVAFACWKCMCQIAMSSNCVALHCFALEWNELFSLNNECICILSYDFVDFNESKSGEWKLNIIE